MKQSPELQKIQEEMKPGAITLNGFLGPDTRALIDILAEDEQSVKNLGLTHAEIGRAMSEIRNAGKKGLGEFTHVDPNFEVRVESVRGKLPSPFGGPGLYPKTNTQVRNTQIDKEVVFSDMQIHLIGDHGFYEGKGSPYRLEPALLAEVLEIVPEAD